MNRSIILFAAGALVLAGCPSDPVTPGTDSGPSGLDAPTGTDTGVPETDTGVPETDTGVPETDGGGADAPAAGGACLNAADGAALESMGDAVSDAAADCATSCITSATRVTCINDCMQDEDHLDGAISSPCTTCFAGAASCTIDHCITICIGDPSSDECVQCQCDNCAEAYGTCSGIPDSRCTP